METVMNLPFIFPEHITDDWLASAPADHLNAFAKRVAEVDDLTVCIPFKQDSQERALNLALSYSRIFMWMPGVTVHIVGDTPPWGLRPQDLLLSMADWTKTSAMNQSLVRTHTRRWLMLDADVLLSAIAMDELRLAQPAFGQMAFTFSCSLPQGEVPNVASALGEYRLHCVGNFIGYAHLFNTKALLRFGGQFEQFTVSRMDDVAMTYFFKEPRIPGCAIHLYHPVAPSCDIGEPGLLAMAKEYDSNSWLKPREPLLSLVRPDFNQPTTTDTKEVQ
jgi:hypothetical protein